MKSVVYVSYNGALEPLGRSQVLAYLRPLAREFDISLITFEKAEDLADVARVRATADDLAAAGIRWTFFQYRRSLAGKILNLLEGAWRAWRIARARRAFLFHARSHVAGAMTLLARSVHGGRLLFDLRGELAEEYADSGHWRRGSVLYRATRGLERLLLARCDALVVLTEHLARRIPPRPGRLIEVIPCCVDRRVFASEGETSPEALRHLAGRKVLVYSGSVGTWYLLNEMFALFRAALRERENLHFLLLSRSEHERIAAAASAAGLTRDQWSVVAETYERVPAYLRASGAGIAFILPVLSKRGSSPVKVAEYLACGLPVIVNAGVGDLEDFVEQEGIGVVLRSFDAPELERGARFLAAALDDAGPLRARCLEVAERRFDLDGVGVARYRALYERLGSGQPSSVH